MFSFNGGPGPYDRYNRPRRRMRVFPWWLIFAFFWIAPHGFWGPLITVGVILLIIFAIMRSRSANTWMGNQQQYYNPPNGQSPYQQGNSYQQPYYQPSQPPYQPNSMGEQSEAEEPYYQPYNQGYQPQAQAEPYYRPSEQSYPEAEEQSQEDAYQSYDQPKAEYPQQMPPM